MVRYSSHRPVLLEESLSHLALRPDSVIVDCTLGGAGHALAILERTAPGGRLIGLDQDSEALEAARLRLKPFSDRIHLVHASFRNLSEIIAELDIERVDGVLLDLGVSSHQLDAPERGFRFGPDTADETPLDMRMDQDEPLTAAELLRTASAPELEAHFRDYGDLPKARKLARFIVERRQSEPFRTAGDLVRVVRDAGVGGGRRHNPATLVFQALRIAVNDEIHALEEGIESAIDVLHPGGRLVAIAYHSTEDRVVKNRFRDAQRGCTCPPRTPVCICGGRVRLQIITRKPIRPTPEEIRANPRARSARLRAAERVEDAV